MNWASMAIEKLKCGENAIVKPHGNSMTGKIESGQTVELSPINIVDYTLMPKDIVLVKVKGNIYLHLIKAIKNENGKTKFLIGNNKGGTNGWVSIGAIYGIAIKVDDKII